MSMESRSTKSRRRKPPDVFPHLLTRARQARNWKLTTHQCGIFIGSGTKLTILKPQRFVSATKADRRLYTHDDGRARSPAMRSPHLARAAWICSSVPDLKVKPRITRLLRAIRCLSLNSVVLEGCELDPGADSSMGGLPSPPSRLSGLRISCKTSRSCQEIRFPFEHSGPLITESI